MAATQKKLPIKAVLFDMDGTLIDTEKYYRIFWPKALEVHGYHMTDEQALTMRSLGRPHAVKQFQEWYGEAFDYEGVRETRKQLMEAHLDRVGIECKAGVIEALQYLKQQGITTAVATATDLEHAHKYLDKVGIRSYFDKVISAHMVKEGKPSPDIYLYACESLGLQPHECMAVEDSPNGVKSAYRAGCKVVMVPDQTPMDEELQGYVTECIGSLSELVLLCKKDLGGLQ